MENGDPTRTQRERFAWGEEEHGSEAQTGGKPGERGGLCDDEGGLRERITDRAGVSGEEMGKTCKGRINMHMQRINSREGKKILGETPGNE